MAAPRICSVDGCDKPAKKRGWCDMHYARWLRRGDLAWQRQRHICAIDGCGSPVKGQGYCNKHYKRWHRYGDPSAKRCASNGEPIKWLLEHISYTGDECLIWPFARTAAGYGFCCEDGRVENDRYAHRIMCEKVHGKPPTPSHDAAHSCGKGHMGCINPNHLRWATRVENEADKLAHGTRAVGKALPSTKLTPEEVQQMRALAPLVSQRALADKFNVSQSTVHAVIARKNWAWVE